MISLIKVIVEYFSKLLSKRGELRYGYILPAPKLSSSCRILKYLSSCVLLLKFRLKSYSDLFRVSMDPRVKPEGDGRESVLEGDGRESVSEGDNFLLSLVRGGKRGQAIFELGKNLTPLNLLLAKRRVAGGVFLLFLLFPSILYAKICFLPDCHLDDEASSVSIDSERCEDIGYTYYSSGVCPSYHNQEICVFHDKYLKCDGNGWCMDNSYTISSCTNPKIVDTQCPNGLSLYKYCVCPSTYKYACTGTGYSSGNGTVCDGKYTKCNCSTYYSWNGSSCAHVHSYVCRSGYSSSSAGMVSPASASKVCQLSGCSSTSGACYIETHSHSYSCPSGYSTSCSYGYWGTAAKKCSGCPATSGTCYSCKSYCEANPCGSGCYTNLSCSYGCASYNSCGGCQTCKSCLNTCSSGSLSSSCTSPKTASHVATTQCGNKCYSCVCPSTYQYSCSGTGYSGGSGTACNSKYTSCSCASGYSWSGGTCKKQCTDTCAQLRSWGYVLSPYGYGTCNELGTGSGCQDIHCNSYWYCSG